MKHIIYSFSLILFVQERPQIYWNYHHHKPTTAALYTPDTTTKSKTMLKKTFKPNQNTPHIPASPKKKEKTINGAIGANHNATATTAPHRFPPHWIANIHTITHTKQNPPLEPRLRRNPRQNNPCRSAKTYHRFATISTTNPPQTHLIFTHKQNKYPLDPPCHANPRERPITILNAHAMPGHHQSTTPTDTTIHHRNSAPNPRPKPISKPITTHNQICGAPPSCIPAPPSDHQTKSKTMLKKKNHQTKPNFHINQQTQKKKIPLTEPITTPRRSAKTHHRCAIISTTNPPQTHSIFTHKQNKYPLDPRRHADPRERPITILNVNQRPRQATTRPPHPWPPRSTIETQLQTRDQNRLVNPSPPTTKSVELRWCLPIVLVWVWFCVGLNSVFIFLFNKLKF